ncbi:MAG: hypothetical protein V4598_05665 [Bdellovibrionota bacterium]
MIKVQDEKALSKLAVEHFFHLLAHIQTPKKKDLETDIDSFFQRTKCCKKKRFIDLIAGDPKFLKHLMKNHNRSLKKNRFSQRLKDLYNNNFSLRNRTLGGKGPTYNSIALLDKLELRVCPFCNRNYIYNIRKKSGEAFKLSQTDHFYPQDKFPYLAMSFFNLIPSCLQCNFLKNNKKIKVHPYDSVDSHHLKFTVDISLEDTELSLTRCLPNDLKIKASSIFKKNNETLYLDELYRGHIDYVNELLLNIEFYNEGNFVEIQTVLGGLNFTHSEMNRILFGNYTAEEDFNKRPLSKLTYDILKQFNIETG